MTSSENVRARFFPGCLVATCLIAVAFGSRAQVPLFFREDWKEIPAATPVTQEHVAGQRLGLNLYGPGRDGVKKSNRPEIPHDPFYIWSGNCSGNWMLTLHDKQRLVDLRDGGMIALRSRQSGYRHLRLVLKTQDAVWLVSDQSVGPSEEWQETEFRVGDLTWQTLDPDRVAEGRRVDKPDLGRVDEVGFSDLMAGGGTPASSRIDWIAVYGQPVTRKR